MLEFRNPPPFPASPPKVSEPVFVQIEIWGESVGAEGTKNICGLMTRFFLPYMSALKILRIWRRIHKWVKNTQKIDPQLGL